MSISIKDLLKRFPKTYKHDEFCKTLFAIIELARCIFKYILSNAMLAEIDLARLEIVDTKYINRQLRANLCDMLYRVPLKETDTWVYFLLDFKSNNDRGASRQLYRYAHTIWIKLWGDEGEPIDFLFPCVVSIIFHCGESPFTSSTNIVDQVDLPKKSYFRRHAINYESLLYDLNAKLKSDFSDDPIIEMAFTILMIARDEDVNNEALEVFVKFKDNICNDKLFAVVWDISLWYLFTSAKHFTYKTYDNLINLTQKLGVKIMTPSAAETYFKQGETRGETRGIAIGETRGIAIGETRGRAIGETRGRAMGEIRAIIRVLSHRVGEPSEELQNRIMEIQSIDKLDELLEFASTCVSLGEFATALD
jgi:hypothetical protein